MNKILKAIGGVTMIIGAVVVALVLMAWMFSGKTDLELMDDGRICLTEKPRFSLEMTERCYSEDETVPVIFPYND